MADRLQLRRDTAAQWEAVNPILRLCEIGLVIDGAGQVTGMKVGDGRVWNALPLIPIKEKFGASELSDGAVTSEKIADNAVTSSKLSDNAVEASKIADNAVTSSKIALNAVTNDNLSEGSVGNRNIQLGAVGANNIADGAVTTSKLGYLSVTSDKIAPGVVEALIGQSSKNDGPIQIGSFRGKPIYEEYVYYWKAGGAPYSLALYNEIASIGYDGVILSLEAAYIADDDAGEIIKYGLLPTSALVNPYGDGYELRVKENVPSDCYSIEMYMRITYLK